jgi:Rod binding domain-containing protein
MTVEVTAVELNEVLLDADVQALIVQKLSEKKTAGLADALTAQYKSLGIITDSSEPASSDNAGTDPSATDTAADSAEA